MRTFVVLNPAAGGASEAEALGEAVSTRRGWALERTAAAGDAQRLAGRAVAEGYERVVAAGGDGTINEVVQGIVPDGARARLGIVPLGTANDLARTLDIPADPVAAVELIESGRERLIDLIRVETGGRARWCVNMASGGFGGEVDRTLEDTDLKRFWGPLAYVIAAVDAARDLTAYRTIVRVDGGPPEEIAALAAVVANCRTSGGGLRVAPTADPEDGLLDLVIIRHGTVLELGGLAARLAAGTILESPHALHRRARRVTLESDPPMWFNVDGELITREPLAFSVVPRALPVTVGPGYRRAA